MEHAYVSSQSVASLSPLDNRLGGHPSFIDNLLPESELLNCKKCTQPMQLLSQLNASTTTQYRILYLFMCREGVCVSSGLGIRALRAIKLTKLQPVLVPVLDTIHIAPSVLQSDLVFFGDTPESTLDEISLLLSSRKQTKTVAPKKKQAKKKTKQLAFIHDASIWTHGQHFHSTPIDFYPEPSTKVSKAADEYTHEHELLRAYQQETGDIVQQTNVSVKSAIAYDEEAYESFGPKCLDKHMKRFFKHTANDPECVVRFGYGGEALLFKAFQGNERCTACNGSMVFEYQIMPFVLTLLERKERQLEENKIDTRESFIKKCEGLVDFATLIVMTCEGGCGGGDTVEYKEDIVSIQADSLF